MAADARDPRDLRVEHDLPGHRDVPDSAHWGVHAPRAVGSFTITGRAIVIARHCVARLTANQARLAETVRRTVGIVAALDPYTGDEKSSALAQEAHATGRGVVERALEKGWLSKHALDRIPWPKNLTRPRPPVRG
jgi:aspartate ammonia-lyase